jgi:hypothetical protein
LLTTIDVRPHRLDLPPKRERILRRQPERPDFGVLQHLDHASSFVAGTVWPTFAGTHE